MRLILILLIITFSMVQNAFSLDLYAVNNDGKEMKIKKSKKLELELKSGKKLKGKFEIIDKDRISIKENTGYYNNSAPDTIGISEISALKIKGGEIVTLLVFSSFTAGFGILNLSLGGWGGTFGDGEVIILSTIIGGSLGIGYSTYELNRRKWKFIPKEWKLAIK